VGGSAGAFAGASWVVVWAVVVVSWTLLLLEHPATSRAATVRMMAVVRMGPSKAMHPRPRELGPPRLGRVAQLKWSS
jgi:hypothetical protein